MTNNDPLTRINFDMITCSRCGGSGMFGPKQVHGGVCFSCVGKGMKLSRKGSLARAFFEENLDTMNKAPEDIVPGDKIWANCSRSVMGVAMRWATVTGVTKDQYNEGCYDIEAQHKDLKVGVVTPNPIRVWNKDLWDAAVRATILMPGASLPAEAKEAQEANEAPVKQASPKRSSSSHKDCTHESTPKARAACRKARAQA